MTNEIQAPADAHELPEPGILHEVQDHDCPSCQPQPKTTGMQAGSDEEYFAAVAYLTRLDEDMRPSVERLSAAPRAPAPAHDDQWRHRAIRWLRDMQTAKVDSPYFSNGMFRQDCANLIDALTTQAPAVAHQVPEGMALVPVKPTRGLLISMAIRSDHGLGIPGYYDEMREHLPADHPMKSVTHAQRMQSTMNSMRQLHEEVVGTGFYKPEREASYAGMQPMPRGDGQGFDEPVGIHVIVEPEEWRPSIREAIDAAISAAESDVPVQHTKD